MNNKVTSTHTSLREVNYVERRHTEGRGRIQRIPSSDFIFFRITKASPVSDTIDIDVCSYADIQQ